MDINRSLSNEFSDIFDIDRDIRLAEKLSRKKDLKERTNKNIREFMENQAKNASKGSSNVKE